MKLRHFIYIAGLLLVGFFVYFNSLDNGFNLDDNVIIKDNPLVTSLKNLPKVFTSNYWANTPYEKSVLLYRPIPVATFAVDDYIYEGSAYGFHFTNAIFNAINGVLLFYMLLLLFGDGLKPKFAALAALLFVVHPAHTEAVNMIVGRTELLAAFFSFIAIICHLQKKIVWALVMFFFAMLSKEIAVTIPLMLFFYEWLVKKEVEKKNYFFYVLVFAIYALIRYAVLGGLTSAGQSGILAGQDFFARSLTVIYTIGLYLKLMFAPLYLTADYSDYPLPVSFFELKVLVSLAAALILLVVAWKTKEKKPFLTLGILWFFVTILPVSNILSIGALLGERFLYIPSVALIILASAIFFYYGFIIRTLLAVLLSILVVMSGIYTYDRNKDWKDGVTLFSAAAKHQPDNPRVNFYLGLKAEAEKDKAKAIEYYEKAIQMFPQNNWHPDSGTINNMKEKILSLKDEAINKVSIEAANLYNAGLKLYKEQKFDQALAKLKNAVELDKAYADAWVVMGGIYVEKQDPKNAVECFEKALKIKPDHKEAKENLRRVREFYKLK